MAKTFRRVTTAHRAALSAAAKKRWAKKPTRSEFARTIAEDMKIGSTLRVRLPNDFTVTDTPLYINRTVGLISRMTQAIDKIKEQIERLESL